MTAAAPLRWHPHLINQNGQNIGIYPASNFNGERHKCEDKKNSVYQFYGNHNIAEEKIKLADFDQMDLVNLEIDPMQVFTNKVEGYRVVTSVPDPDIFSVSASKAKQMNKMYVAAYASIMNKDPYVTNLHLYGENVLYDHIDNNRQHFSRTLVIRPWLESILRDLFRHDLFAVRLMCGIVASGNEELSNRVFPALHESIFDVCLNRWAVVNKRWISNGERYVLVIDRESDFVRDPKHEKIVENLLTEIQEDYVSTFELKGYDDEDDSVLLQNTALYWVDNALMKKGHNMVVVMSIVLNALGLFFGFGKERTDNMLKKTLDKICTNIRLNFFPKRFALCNIANLSDIEVKLMIRATGDIPSAVSVKHEKVTPSSSPVATTATTTDSESQRKGRKFKNRVVHTPYKKRKNSRKAGLVNCSENQDIGTESKGVRNNQVEKKEQRDNKRTNMIYYVNDKKVVTLIRYVCHLAYKTQTNWYAPINEYTQSHPFHHKFPLFFTHVLWNPSVVMFQIPGCEGYEISSDLESYVSNCASNPDYYYVLLLSRLFQRGRLYWSTTAMKNFTILIKKITKRVKQVFKSNTNNNNRVIQYDTSLIDLFKYTQQTHPLPLMTDICAFPHSSDPNERHIFHDDEQFYESPSFSTQVCKLARSIDRCYIDRQGPRYMIDHSICISDITPTERSCLDLLDDGSFFSITQETKKLLFHRFSEVIRGHEQYNNNPWLLPIRENLVISATTTVQSTTRAEFMPHDDYCDEKSGFFHSTEISNSVTGSLINSDTRHPITWINDSLFTGTAAAEAYANKRFVLLPCQYSGLISEFRNKFSVVAVLNRHLMQDSEGNLVRFDKSSWSQPMFLLINHNAVSQQQINCLSACLVASSLHIAAATVTQSQLDQFIQQLEHRASWTKAFAEGWSVLISCLYFNSDLLMGHLSTERHLQLHKLLQLGSWLSDDSSPFHCALSGWGYDTSRLVTSIEFAVSLLVMRDTQDDPFVSSMSFEDFLCGLEFGRLKDCISDREGVLNHPVYNSLAHICQTVTGSQKPASTASRTAAGGTEATAAAAADDPLSSLVDSERKTEDLAKLSCQQLFKMGKQPNEALVLQIIKTASAVVAELPFKTDDKGKCDSLIAKVESLLQCLNTIEQIDLIAKTNIPFDASLLSGKTWSSNQSISLIELLCGIKTFFLFQSNNESITNTVNTILTQINQKKSQRLKSCMDTLFL